MPSCSAVRMPCNQEMQHVSAMMSFTSFHVFGRRRLTYLRCLDEVSRIAPLVGRRTVAQVRLTADKQDRDVPAADGAHFLNPLAKLKGDQSIWHMQESLKCRSYLRIDVVERVRRVDREGDQNNVSLRVTQWPQSLQGWRGTTGVRVSDTSIGSWMYCYVTDLILFLASCVP